MKLIGLMLVRNEDWILPFSLNAALMWCDEVILFDHASENQDLIKEAQAYWPSRVTVMREDNPVFLEMDFRQRMLNKAREKEATHLALVDGDEALTYNLIPEIRGMIQNVVPNKTLCLPMIQPYTLEQHRTDRKHCIAVGLADGEGVFWKDRNGYQLHRRHPYGRNSEVKMQVDGGVFHFQFIDPCRLLEKHAWYKMMETVQYPGRTSPKELDRKYSVTPDLNGAEFKAIPQHWWGDYNQRAIRIGMPTWHKRECQRMMKEYGPETFKGLNLWGVA